MNWSPSTRDGHDGDCQTVPVLVTLLGPVAAEAEGLRLPLGGAKQRAVFALLALNVGHVVSLDRLVDELWSDEPPSRAILTLQSYVSRLRRLLSQAAEPGQEPPEILTRPPGWILTLAPDQVDVFRFESALTQGRAALDAGQAGEAATLLRQALDLWHGEVLADLSSMDFAREESARLDELRLWANELLFESLLAGGDNDLVAHRARRFVADHPYRERAWCALMLSLYRGGRQSEAVAAAAQVRRTLVDELGLDPSPQVRDLEQRILRQAPDLELPVTSLPDLTTVPPGPPSGKHGDGPAGPALVGRLEVIAQVEDAVSAAANGRGRLLVLEAPAGFGKTSVLDVLVDRVEAAGGAVVRSGGVGATAMPALWPWVSIARELTELVEDPSGRTTPAWSELSQTLLYRSMIDLLTAASQGRVLGVLLDDLHWVDAETLTLLLLAVDELAARGVLFVVAVRTDEPTAPAVLQLIGRARRDLVTRIPLRPLEPGDVATLVRDVSGSEPAASVAAAIHARTAGNPFFVGELVRLLTSERSLDVQGVNTTLPGEVREVLRRRIERLPEQTVALLTVISLVGSPTAVELLAHVTGLDVDTVLDACESALLVGLLVEDTEAVGSFTLSHDLVRQTLDQALSSARRIRLHAKIAAALQARDHLAPQQVVQLARHLTIAAPVVGPEAAVPYLVAASEDAISRFANSQAEASLLSALELSRQIVDPATRTALEAQVQGRLANLRVWTLEAVPNPGPLVGPGPPHPPPPLGAEATAGWVGNVITYAATGRYRWAREVAEGALAEELPPVGQFGARYVLGWAHYVCGDLQDADREFARAEELIDSGQDTSIPADQSNVHTSLAAHEALVAHDLGDDARADARMAVAADRARDNPFWQVNIELNFCWLAAMRGDAAAARTHVDACREFTTRLQYPVFELLVGIVAAWSDTMLGDLTGPARAHAAYEAYHASGLRLMAPCYLVLVAEAHAAVGEASLAVEAVRRSRAITAEVGEPCHGPRLTAFADQIERR